MYFVRLIFAQAMLSENILTWKYSRFTVILKVHDATAVRTEASALVQMPQYIHVVCLLLALHKL